VTVTVPSGRVVWLLDVDLSNFIEETDGDSTVDSYEGISRFKVCFGFVSVI